MPRIRLLATCQINGTIHHAGEIVEIPEGQRGPHRTVVASGHGAQIAAPRYQGDNDPDAGYVRQPLLDQPLYELVDEDIEREQTEMRERHAAELAELEKTAGRDELLKRQAVERAELHRKRMVSAERQRHEQEAGALEERQRQEMEAFEKREQNRTPGPPPPETDKDALESRHLTEMEDLDRRRQEGERRLNATLGPAPERTEPGVSTYPPIRPEATAGARSLEFRPEDGKTDPDSFED